MKTLERRTVRYLTTRRSNNTYSEFRRLRVPYPSRSSVSGWALVSDDLDKKYRTIFWESNIFIRIFQLLLRAYLVILANRCFFFVCISGQRGTIALKLSFTYEQHYLCDVCWFADVVTSFSGITFVLFCFVFVSVL